MGKKNIPALIWILRVLILISVYLGCISTAETAWQLGAIGVGLMAWLNLIAIILLHRKVLHIYNDYLAQRKNKKDPEFDNAKFNFPNMDIWNNSKS